MVLSVPTRDTLIKFLRALSLGPGDDAYCCRKEKTSNSIGHKMALRTGREKTRPCRRKKMLRVSSLRWGTPRPGPHFGNTSGRIIQIDDRRLGVPLDVNAATVGNESREKVSRRIGGRGKEHT